MSSGYQFIITRHPESGDETGFDVPLTKEDVRIIMLAIAGFELTREERATIRPVYMSLYNEMFVRDQEDR